MFGLESKYFVLKPRSKDENDPYARASRQAIRAYADSIESENNDLAFDLRRWANEEE